MTVYPTEGEPVRYPGCFGVARDGVLTIVKKGNDVLPSEILEFWPITSVRKWTP